MAGVKVLVPLLAALLLLVVAATASRESCKSVNLKHCEKHIMHRIEHQDEDEDHVLKMRGMKNNVRRSSSGDRREEDEEDENEWRRCCDALSELDSSECRCRALNEIMENQSEKVEGKDERRDMKRELGMLPMTCGFGQLWGCEIKSQDD